MPEPDDLEITASNRQALKRLQNALKNLGVNCLECRENLTLDERLHGKVYCESCWLDILQHDEIGR